MTQLPSPHGRRVLIIEDEFLIALDLETTMFKLGFDVCALAPSARKARSLAMNDHPDVALVDVCLEGGREGIEIARWLREVCEVPIVFVTAQTDEDTVEQNPRAGPRGTCPIKAGLSSHPRRCRGCSDQALNRGPSYPLINNSFVPASRVNLGP